MIYFKGETKMKKIIATLLATAMIAGCAISASAAEYVGDKTGMELADTDKHDVYVTYENAEDQVDKFAIDVAWGSMKFTYKAAQETWDTVNHMWKSENGQFTCEAGADTITVTNHSSKDIDANFTYAKDNLAGDESTLAFESNTLKVERILQADEGKTDLTGTRAIKTNKVSLSGNIQSKVGLDEVKIGTITITFAQSAVQSAIV